MTTNLQKNGRINMAIPPEFKSVSTPKNKLASIHNLKQQVKSLSSADIPLKLKRILIDILTHLENK